MSVGHGVEDPPSDIPTFPEHIHHLVPDIPTHQKVPGTKDTPPPFERDLVPDTQLRWQMVINFGKYLCYVSNVKSDS